MTGSEPPTRFVVFPHNIDGAMRYYAVIRLLAERFSPDLRVLEVGSGSGGVTEFLEHPVTGVDPAFERTADRRTEWLQPVAGSVEALPFEDASFDAVLSVEMLEHVPEKARQRALEELFRVTAPGGRLIVTFPADEVGERLDRRFNQAYRARFGEDHPWLAEHLSNGLPSTEDARAMAERAVAGSGSVAVVKHGWAPVWLLHQLLFSAQWGFPVTLWLGIHTRWGARLFFRALRRVQLGHNSYRTILVIDRAPMMEGAT
jgi:SAM-dependent methyltransferase